MAVIFRSVLSNQVRMKRIIGEAAAFGDLLQQCLCGLWKIRIADARRSGCESEQLDRAETSRAIFQSMAKISKLAGLALFCGSLHCRQDTTIVAVETVDKIGEQFHAAAKTFDLHQPVGIQRAAALGSI